MTYIPPCINDHRSTIREGENALAFFAADSEVNNHGFVVAFNYRWVCRVFAAWLSFSIHLGHTAQMQSLGADSAAPSIASMGGVPIQASNPSWRDTRRRVPNC
jgi:hypothetical protein